MTAYLTPYDPAARECTGPSQPLADSLDAAVQVMGEPSSRRAAMLFYYGPPAFVVSQAILCIDAPRNSGQNVIDSNDPGSKQP